MLTPLVGRERSKHGQRGVSEALHVTWYCIYADEGRPTRGAER